MDTPPPPKKGLGPLAWLGIGCGALIVIIIVVLVVFGMVAGPKLKKFAEEAQKNPTRATATTMVSMTGGQFEMVKEDDVNKRYTVRQKSNGQLTTIYWDAKQNKPMTVTGDFSAIPADANSSSAPATPAAN
ncbi:MAG TPA: hypothetical protein VK961_15970 [Chthoniobacter sp.]|nr:hypothetical protein [Chthoniobacter sp.]